MMMPLKSIFSLGRSLLEASRGQKMTVRMPERAITTPETMKPGIIMEMNCAPAIWPRAEPKRVPAEMNADMVPRMDSGTRSDREAMTGAIIMFSPTMARQ